MVLYLGFVNFTNAFDSVLYKSIFNTLAEIGIEELYILLIKELYKDYITYIVMRKKRTV